MARMTVTDPATQAVPIEPQESAVTIRLAPGGGLSWDEENRLMAAGGAGAVTSVNGETGDVVLEAADVGALASAAGSVAATNLATNSVTTAKIANANVTLAKLAAEVTARLLTAQAPAQADSTAADVAALVADFNALLAKLRTAGVIAT